MRDSVEPQPRPDRRRGLYRGGPRNGTKEGGEALFFFTFVLRAIMARTCQFHHLCCIITIFMATTKKKVALVMVVEVVQACT